MAQMRQRGWWYPYIFLGFFVVVVGVNATMAFFATSTFTGLSTDNAYEKGLAYNQNLAMARAQAELGWRVETRLTPGTAAGKGEFAITYRDKAGQPLDGLEVHAALSRPTQRGYDRDVVLAATGPGTYVAPLALPLSGEWDVEVMAAGGGAIHQSQNRIILP
jgi:nitrogen fixation protein FixH